MYQNKPIQENGTKRRLFQIKTLSKQFFTEITPGHKFGIIRLITNNVDLYIGTTCYYHSDNFKFSKLIEIIILKEYQSKGYGTNILRFVLFEALNWGSLYVSLYVSHKNLAAIHIYKKLGFEEWKQFENGFSMIRFCVKI